ncbi:MAG TPA: ATP-binding protein [Opitutaceae bacterium]|nr:ATP-binding protein [Opitutaceae bacterium]
MRSEIRFSADEFDNLFPFHLGFRSDGIVTHVGRSLRRLAPHAAPGATLSDLLRPRRPDEPFAFSTLAAAAGQLHVVEEPVTGTLLRGQMQPIGDRIFFLGSPWLESTSDLDRLGLTFDDYAVHDPTLDLLHLLEVQKIAAADLKRLAAQLSARGDQLRARENESRKLALVAARTDNGVVITDPLGRIEWVNEGFTRITGYVLADCAGHKPGALLQGPATDHATVVHMHQQIARGEGFKVEIVNYHKLGRPYWVAVEVQPIHDATGRLVNFMGIQGDITARREAEEALRKHSAELARANIELAQAARMKSAFLASMSHELRTPLTGILGMSETLLEQAFGPLNEKQMRYLRVVESSGRHLLALINDLLDVAKIEAGQLELNPQPCSLEDICAGAMQTASDLAKKRNQRIGYVNRAGAIALRVDARRMVQVLDNLLTNAAKFTPPEGEFGLEVRSAGAHVIFSVWDRGIGIAEADLPRIFQPFVQLDERLSRRYEGTGLGLALVRHLVAMHQGRVDVASEPGRGSTFTLTIPRELSAASA